MPDRIDVTNQKRLKQRILIVVSVVLAWILILWFEDALVSRTIMIVVPDGYTGELRIVRDKTVQENRSVNEILKHVYVWTSDAAGAINVGDDSVRYKWHRIEAKYVSGMGIPVFVEDVNEADLKHTRIYLFETSGIPDKGDFFIGTLKEAKSGIFQY